jgi:molybdopterin molybdotransferase
MSPRMPTFEDARATILHHATVLGAEHVSVLDAVGRVLADGVVAPWDLPLWDNSAMDGYAVRAGECAAPGGLRIAGYIPAGTHSSQLVAAGTAAKILTGAPLPPGADAVVPVEETEERDGNVLLTRAVRPGAHVRRKGEDIRAGEMILRAGTVVGPSEVSLLASFSRVSVPVVRRARVAIVSTGDELVEAGEALSPGKIYDSNALAVAAAVKQLGGEPIRLGIARDDRTSLRALLAEGLQADVLVTSAGVSMGDRDLVREILADLSVQQLFWKVEVKPGRPTAFGVRGNTLVFSLPGNPVSTLLTFEQFVRPALLKMMGHQALLRPMARAIFQEELALKPGRVSFLRVRLERRNEGLLAWTSGNQETGILKTMLQADGIAVIPADWGSVGAGDAVDVQLLRAGAEV